MTERDLKRWRDRECVTESNGTESEATVEKEAVTVIEAESVMREESAIEIDLEKRDLDAIENREKQSVGVIKNQEKNARRESPDNSEKREVNARGSQRAKQKLPTMRLLITVTECSSVHYLHPCLNGS